jgi:hypothetical protein
VRPNTFDLGISINKITSYLEEQSVLMIVGYKRSGKSTLSEILEQHLTQIGYNVLLQNAKSWLANQSSAQTYDVHNQSCIDPELVAVFERFEKSTSKGCWIVDDAEILFAYASQGMLARLGERLKEGKFHLIAIRNRFIFEDFGWFNRRQKMISSTILTETMVPLETEERINAVSLIFHGNGSSYQVSWLSRMSGGIPGFISELYPYVPEIETQSISEKLKGFILKEQLELNLTKTTRTLLLNALSKKVLPPVAFLTYNAKAELGTLILKGMVSEFYSERENPFNGEFWELVIEQKYSPYLIPVKYYDLGLDLEIIIRNANFIDSFSEEYSFDSSKECVLGQILANCFYCEETYPSLVVSIESLFTEFFGKHGLIKLLRSAGISADITEITQDLYRKLIKTKAN